MNRSFFKVVNVLSLFFMEMGYIFYFFTSNMKGYIQFHNLKYAYMKNNKANQKTNKKNRYKELALFTKIIIKKITHIQKEEVCILQNRWFSISVITFRVILVGQNNCFL